MLVGTLNTLTEGIAGSTSSDSAWDHTGIILNLKPGITLFTDIGGGAPETVVELAEVALIADDIGSLIDIETGHTDIDG